MSSSFFKGPRVWLVVILLIGFVSGLVGGLAGGVFVSNWFFLPPTITNWFTPRPHAAGTVGSSPNAPAGNAEDQTVTSVQTALPAVVSILISKDVNTANQTGPDVFNFGPFGFSLPQEQLPSPTPKTKQRQQVGAGTGFIVTADGMIATNRHVVVDESAQYLVVLNDGRKFDAKVLGRDPVLDVAIIKIEATNLPVVQLGDSDKLKVGQSVIAIGNTLAEYRNTVTRGIISGIGRRVDAGGVGIGTEVIEGAIQTDAAINPGNSGGPLIDLAGRVIGINTAINNQGQSIGFAIPINEAKRVIESVKLHGKIVRPWLGVRYVLLNEQIAEENQLPVKAGALVVRGQKQTDLAVIPGGPADKAGIRENDIIISADGVAIDAEHPLGLLVGKKNPDDTVSLLVRRGNVEKTVGVTLGEFPQK